MTQGLHSWVEKPNRLHYVLLHTSFLDASQQLRFPSRILLKGDVNNLTVLYITWNPTYNLCYRYLPVIHSYCGISALELCLHFKARYPFPLKGRSKRSVDKHFKSNRPFAISGFTRLQLSCILSELLFISYQCCTNYPWQKTDSLTNNDQLLSINSFFPYKFCL